MDENNRTNFSLLSKGAKQLIICLVLMFSGPTLLYFILNNKGKPFYIVLLIMAILICLLAIVFLFLGINTILNSIFKKPKSNNQR